MTLFDVILLIILFGFILFGIFFGFIHALGSLFGVVIGTWVAGHYFTPFAEWLTPFFAGNETWAKAVAFLIIFMLVNRLVGLVFYVIGKAFNLISIIPFLKTINRLLGAILGFFEGVLVIGIVIYVVSQFGVSSWLDDLFATSKIAKYFVDTAAIIKPLIPDAVKEMQGYYQGLDAKGILDSGKMKEYNDMIQNAANE